MKIMMIVALAVGLSGCVTAEQVAQQDNDKCRSYGAQPGTPAYVQCRTQLDTTRTTARAMILASPSTCSTVAGVTNCY